MLRPLGQRQENNMLHSQAARDHYPNPRVEGGALSREARCLARWNLMMTVTTIFNRTEASNNPDALMNSYEDNNFMTDHTFNQSLLLVFFINIFFIINKAIQQSLRCCFVG
mmetsp:Transcript_20972/g.37890  ORF Transcript_20972/g.37890 Transcript_20972/m.37890 type:complete len:111 (-) Transcript_20972:943-1275(-)